MSVGSIMSRSIVTVGMDDTLAVVKNIFDETGFHHLLVVDEGRLFGVVSDRDVLRALSPHIGTLSEMTRDAATLKKRVHHIMTRELLTLKQNAEITDAVNIFNHHSISCIPIVDDEGRAVGIISWRDILKYMVQSWGDGG